MENNNHIYLDHAATSFPKPQKVLDLMVETYSRLGASPGRGGYDLSVEAADFVFQTREKIARFFHAPDPDRVVFTANATDSLNLAIQGIIGPGDHVVATQLEHNSVLRPLFHLHERCQVEYDLVRFDGQGQVDPEEIAKTIKPKTKLVVLSHASNILGSVQPVPEIAGVCAERGIPLLLDVAQSAGHVQIDMTGWNVQAIAFTGHKALLGPNGIGGLIVSPELDIKSTRFGGTGLDSINPRHTQSFPHRLEAGTLNTLGIYGLSAALDYLGDEENQVRERQKGMALCKRLYEGLGTIPGVVIHSPPPSAQGVPLLTCTVKGMASADVGDILDGDYHIAVRTGLHCAPLTHASLGTSASGAVRFSLGFFNKEEEIDRTIAAMAAIAAC